LQKNNFSASESDREKMFLFSERFHTAKMKANGKWGKK